MSDTWTDDLAFALELADLADRITMSRFRASDLQVATKPDRSPVTEADRAVEEQLWARVAERRPEEGRYGEEFGAVGDLEGRCWVLDPIDGTANYLRGVPVWATLIALLVEGQPVIGVASAPAMGRRWWADPSSAHTCDVDGTTRPLTVSRIADLTDASVSYSDDIGWDAHPGGLDLLRALAWRTRGFGDFWSHLLVAEGAVDLAVEPVLKPWDVGALLPIVTAAGGRLTALDGRPALTYTDGDFHVDDGALTTNGLLTDAAVELMSDPGTQADPAGSPAAPA